MEENYLKSKNAKNDITTENINKNPIIEQSKESKESIDTVNFIKKTISKLECFYNKKQFEEQFNVNSNVAMLEKIKKIYSCTSLIIGEENNQDNQEEQLKKLQFTDSAVHFLLKSIYDIVLTKDEIFIYIIDSTNNVVYVFNSKIGEEYKELTNDYIVHYINCPEKIYKFWYPKLKPEIHENKYC